jgi:hypothetical protein
MGILNSDTQIFEQLFVRKTKIAQCGSYLYILSMHAVNLIGLFSKLGAVKKMLTCGQGKVHVKKLSPIKCTQVDSSKQSRVYWMYTTNLKTILVGPSYSQTRVETVNHQKTSQFLGPSHISCTNTSTKSTIGALIK